MGIISDALTGASNMLNDQQLKDDVVANVKKMMLMPETSEYGKGSIPSEEKLSKMPWSDLLALRGQLPRTEDQNAIAPYEHRAYARENSGTLPEALQQVIATPVYTGVKFANRAARAGGVELPIGGSRSDPSLAEIGQGLRGVWEGWTK